LTARASSELLGLALFYAVLLLAATLYMLIMVFGLMESDEYVMKIQ
jgi:hypothetical protein